jgi:hypothetical protein
MAEVEDAQVAMAQDISSWYGYAMSRITSRSCVIQQLTERRPGSSGQHFLGI